MRAVPTVAQAVVAAIRWPDGQGVMMPLINVKVMEKVLTADQKQEVAARFTDAFADVVGEPTRPLTWVIIEDIPSGQLVIGGDSVTTEGVQDILAAPAAARTS
jgi:4-oxalocrotonate tautomerase